MLFSLQKNLSMSRINAFEYQSIVPKAREGSSLVGSYNHQYTLRACAHTSSSTRPGAQRERGIRG
jgi:hypothetical protein